VPFGNKILRNVIRHSYHLYAKTWQRRSMQIRTDTGYIITIIGWRGMSLLVLADIFYVSESTHTFLFVNWKFNRGAETDQRSKDSTMANRKRTNKTRRWTCVFQKGKQFQLLC
jgi:uncharacterized membrane protein